MPPPMENPGSDPGGGPIFGGHGPPMQVLFSENVSVNERIWSHRRGVSSIYDHHIEDFFTFEILFSV